MAVEWRKIITTADMPSGGAYMGSGNSYAKGLVLAGASVHGSTFLRKDGTWATPTDNNTWTALSGTVSGYVTTQGSSSTSVFLNGNGAWSTPTDNNTWTALTGTVSGYVTTQGSSSTSVFLNGNGAWSTPTDTTTNTQNTYASSWVNSSNDALLRITSGGAVGTATQDIKIVAGTGITVEPSGTNLTIANSVTNTNTWRKVTAGGGDLSASEDLIFGAGTGITIAESGGTVTITNSVTDTNTWTALTGTVSGYVTNQGSSSTSVFLNGNAAWSTPPNDNDNTTTTADVLTALTADWGGASSWNAAGEDTLTIGGKIIISGDLDVQGTTTTIDSTTTSFVDASIILNTAVGEATFGNSASVMVFGDSTSALSTGRIINAGTADGGFKFMTGNSTNTPAGNNNVSDGGGYSDVWMKELRLEVLPGAPSIVAGGIYTKADGFYVAY